MMDTSDPIQKLNLPSYNFRISEKVKDKPLIFDAIRKKFVSLTPEEWVRQNIIQFLITEKKVPNAWISIEAGFRINKLAKRYDAVVYSRNAKPWMLVECKATSVSINQETFDQAAAYNRSVNATYILVTNGLKHYCCYVDQEKGNVTFMNDIPDFEDPEK